MTINIIEKSELSSVIFIRDYIQFVFEGKKENFILSAFTMPSTVVKYHKYNLHTSGWRDALCTLINKIVKTSIVDEGISIKIIFENGDLIEISLKDEDYEGPEAAMLYEDDGQITVW